MKTKASLSRLMRRLLLSFVLIAFLVQPARAGQLGAPVSVGERTVVFYLGPGGGFDSSQSLTYVDTTSSMNVDDFKDPRVPYGFLHDVAADFSLSSISSGTTVTIRLLVHEALLNEGTSLPFPAQLTVGMFGGSEVVSLAGFPPPESIFNQNYTIPLGDYSRSPYVLDIDLTRPVQSLMSSGYQYAEVYLGTGPGNHSLGPEQVTFSFDTNPEPSSLTLGIIGMASSLVVIALRKWRR